MTDDCNNHGRETVRRINPSNSSCNRVMPSSIPDTGATWQLMTVDTDATGQSMAEDIAIWVR